MSHEIRNRIVRAGREEERHGAIRKQIEQELPELVGWAKTAAAHHREKIAMGTLLSAEESPVLHATDDYARSMPCPVEARSFAKLCRSS